MPLANVALTDTFDIWRIRTNQLIYLAEGANDGVSFANTVAQKAFDKANSANLLALSTGIISNAFTSATIAGANTAVGTGANAFSSATISGANAYLISIIAGANTAVGTAANAFSSATIAGANAYLISIIAGANTAVGTGANAFSSATIAGANTYTNTLIAASFGQANTANIRAVAAFEKANSIVIAINDDVVNMTRYVAFVNNTTGNASTINVSSSGLFFNPSTRTLTANNISVPFSLGIGTAPSGTVGEIRATSDITAYYSSDISLKENINVIPNALDKLMNIRGVSFDWNQSYIDERGGEDGYFVRRKDVGIIAQEVEKILPEVVATRDNGIKAVKYEKLIALLIEAIKELNTKIENK